MKLHSKHDMSLEIIVRFCFILVNCHVFCLRKPKEKIQEEPTLKSHNKNTIELLSLSSFGQSLAEIFTLSQLLGYLYV